MTNPKVNTGIPSEDLYQDVVPIKIGKRGEITIEILPLSISDQKELGELAQALLRGLVAVNEKEETTEVSFLSNLFSAISENIPSFLDRITEWKGDRPLIDHITNPQLHRIVEIVYAQNYEPIIKKGQGLFKILGVIAGHLPQMTLLLERSSQPSSDTTPSSDLKISSDEVGVKEG